MKSLILVLVIVSIQKILSAQDSGKEIRPNKNHLSIEIGGAGRLPSINYERLIKAKYNKLLARVGLSYVPLTVNNKQAIGTPILPFGLYYLIGNKHHLELGLNNSLGYTVDNITDKNEFSYLVMPSVGYRFENFFKKSVYFSIAYSPAFYLREGNSQCVNCEKSNLQFQHWAKIGIGYSF